MRRRVREMTCLLAFATTVLAAPTAWAQALPDRAKDASTAAEKAPALSPPKELSSPRATFRTFLEAMGAFKEGEKAGLERAVATLDLSAVPSAVRAQVGAAAARKLSTFLDKTELIVLDNIPDLLMTGSYVWRRMGAGEVSLSRREADGAWLFSKSTLASLENLVESVRGRDFVEGIQGEGEATLTLADGLRARMPASLRKRTFLLENWQWLALILLVIVGVVLDRIFRYLVGVQVKRLLGRASSKINPEHAHKFQHPVGILVMATLWSLVLPLLDLPIQATEVIGTAVELIMTAALVWALYRLVDLGAAYFAVIAARTESKLDDLLVPMVRRAGKIIVVSFGLVFIAQNLDIPVASLLTGLGLGGLAFALAAKDTVENLFGSVTVLTDRPFQIGDWIVLDDLEGTVVEVGFRSTRIRTFYNSIITVPNSRLVSTAVDNLGAREWRRIKCQISVTYDTPPERIEAFCEGMRELVRRHPYTRKDYYNIYLNQFGESGLNILFYVFHKAPDWTTELRERHRLFMDIIRLADRLGVEFAFPTQTLHIASTPAGMTPSASSSVSPSAPPQQSEGYEDLVRLGREEAQAIVRDAWGAGSQPPVDFREPDRIRPAEFR